MLIGIMGKAGVGKTTIADYLAWNRGFLVLSFSKALKKAVSNLFDIPLVDLIDPIKKTKIIARWNKSPRTIMQLFGTDCIRNYFGGDFWIDKVRQEIALTPGKDVVIDDVRFLDEANFVTDKGGSLIRVIRPENPLALQSTEAQHISEQNDELQTGHVIINDRAKVNLHQKTDWLLDALTFK